MIKSNKKNVIISALLSIVMCISLIVGVTLAVATSDSKVNIAITGAKIEVVATVDETSVQKKQLNTEYAADGSTYSGEVEFDGGTVSLKNFVAGDGVKFNIIVKNNSTVTVNYRTLLSVENNSGLFEALKVVVNNETFDGNTLYSSWQSIEVGSEDVTIAVTVELPETVSDNDYSGKTCSLVFGVEAFQGNLAVEDGKNYPKDAESLKAALAGGGEVDVVKDISVSDSKTSSGDRIKISEPTTINLNATITVPGSLENSSNWAALYIGADTTINATTGGINCLDKTDTSASYIGGPYAAHIEATGKTVTVNGGNYYAGGTVFNVQSGTLVINGGFFKVYPDIDTKDYRYVVNCIDESYKDGSANIIVKGGTFVNFDPSNNTAEGANTNFVPVGYSVVSEEKANGEIWYTVVKGTGAASTTVTVDETNKTTEEVKIVSEGKFAGNAAAKATIPVGTKVAAGATELELSIKEDAVPANFAVEITQNAPKALDIHMAGLAADNDKLIKVEFYIEKGLSLVEIDHAGIKMERCGAMKWLDADQEFYYDAATGLVTMLTKNFSTFTYTSDKFYWDDKVKDAKHTYGTTVDTTNKIITIASAKDLALFKYEVTDNKVNYNGYTLNITADIDLGSGFWRPINPVNDLTVNGNGHTISNLLVRSYTHHSDESGDYGFGFIANARGNLTIKNLSFDGANVAKSKGAETRYSGNVGGIVVAYAYGTTLFENVTVTNSTIYGYGKIGCILGMGAAPGISVTFKNCVSKGNSIYGATNLGGLAGNIQRANGVDNGKVENCTVENITVNYDPNTQYGYYVDLGNVNATYKSNDTADGEDVIRSVTGKWYVRDGYYWGTYGDYYVSYGNSSYDAPVDGHTEKIANSEYCVNKAN